jgi:peptidoglycan/xylan/chitin deacetylase (PgdA/CDA1 family)
MDKPGIYKIKYLFKDKYSKTVPIIMYHHIETDENKITSRTVSPEKLKKDLKQIKDLKYTTITFKDLYDYVATYKDLPDKPIIITFDDGYLSNYEYAYPILKELNMKATIFIVGIMAGKDNFNGKEALPHFSYEQAKEMYESGIIDIQSHTFNLHNNEIRRGVLQKDGEKEQEYIKLFKNDIEKSIGEIEEFVGSNVIAFSYPYGVYSEISEKLLRNIGIKATLSINKGSNIVEKGQPDNLCIMRRYTVNNNTDIVKMLNDK